MQLDGKYVGIGQNKLEIGIYVISAKIQYCADP